MREILLRIQVGLFVYHTDPGRSADLADYGAMLCPYKEVRGSCWRGLQRVSFIMNRAPPSSCPEEILA